MWTFFKVIALFVPSIFLILVIIVVLLLSSSFLLLLALRRIHLLILNALELLQVLVFLLVFEVLLFNDFGQFAGFFVIIVWIVRNLLIRVVFLIVFLPFLARSNSSRDDSRLAQVPHL